MIRLPSTKRRDDVAAPETAADRLARARAARAARHELDARTSKLQARDLFAWGVGLAAAAAAGAALFGLVIFVGGGDASDVWRAGSDTDTISRAPIRFGPDGDVSPAPSIVFGARIEPGDVASNLVSDRAFAEAVGLKRVATPRIEMRPAARALAALALLKAPALEDTKLDAPLDGLNTRLAAALGVGFRAHPDLLERDDGRKALTCLATAIYFEARNQSRKGQAAVAEVVLNRVEASYWPNDVCAVINQGAGRRGCQFSYRCNRKKDRVTNKRAWRRSLAMAEFMLRGAPRLQTFGATHYHATYVKPRWARHMQRTAKIGVHIFYRRILSTRRAKRS